MRFAIVAALVAGGLAIGAAFALGGGPRNAYEVQRLVSDRAGHASHADTRLVNAWGLTASPTGPWWTSNEASSTSTLYSGDRPQAAADRARRRRAHRGRVVRGQAAAGLGRRRLRSCALRLRLRGREAACVDAHRAGRLVDPVRGRRRRGRERGGVPRCRDRRLACLRNRFSQRARRRLRRALAARPLGRDSSTRRFRRGTRRSASRRSAVMCSSRTSIARR